MSKMPSHDQRSYLSALTNSFAFMVAQHKEQFSTESCSSKFGFQLIKSIKSAKKLVQKYYIINANKSPDGQQETKIVGYQTSSIYSVQKLAKTGTSNKVPASKRLVSLSKEKRREDCIHGCQLRVFAGNSHHSPAKTRETDFGLRNLFQEGNSKPKITS